ncbi:OmpA family protein [Arcobacter porcinus]|uniref:Lipoprotein YiaD n=1 Tax=Arcobacter porcinus TaxID=1935204 RepID=A0ABX2YCJ3_9BACT|nr:OmpA family protein [Arcobacter porcinus]OCL83315.1 putative lipoprotein YiaD precursor [Arcobacter porcinus]OCL92627.1 putative lipoprotein YiaD precursor [Arcobacter porcinus]
MYKKQEEKEENFWISYADLMAGLLFVFILIVALIVIKYIHTENTLVNSEDRNSRLINKLKDIENTNLELINQIKNIEKLYSQTLNSLENSDENLKIVLNELENQYNQNLQKEEELENINILNEELLVNLSESSKINQELQNKLDGSLEEIILKDQNILKLKDEFEEAKDKIKKLGGIKLELISKIKVKLKDAVNIDEKSGAIKFSSNILFDKNSFALKNESKQELSGALKRYFDVLLKDEDIKKYIETITIEGYTDSDGTYLTNLYLSQKRALSVMQFLYDENIVEKELLNSFVSSSGKSSSNLIYDSKDIEDKDASRRIEIKFTIKNEEAIKELQDYFKKSENENNQ